MKSSFDLSRRQFLKSTTLAAAGVVTIKDFPNVITRRAKADDPIRVGVIGCGGRGTGAMLNVLQASTKVIYPQTGYHTEDVADDATIAATNVRIVALADLFPDRLERCREQLRKLNLDIGDEYCFTGFDAYKQLLAVDEINYVILAAPPHFRPMHLKASIEAGKHVFAEKSLGVDAPGVRMIFEAAELADQKGLGIVCGTQRRHDPGYQETVKRIKDGAIGEIHTARAYWNGGTIWSVAKKPEWSDMEWQLRNWNYFTWLSGDHIVEQHVHNLDVIHWIMGEPPVVARALGGRQARGDNPLYGHIYDHFAVEYEYANGARMFSQCRQMDFVESRVEEGVEGTLGTSNCNSYIRFKDGSEWRYDGPRANPYEKTHQDFIESIRDGKPINEGREVAESTLIGIMGRESAYSGQSITWEQALNSTKSLSPPSYEFGPMPFPEVPIPGKYKFS